MRALVLTYHSHNIAGNDYINNDHVALAGDLEVLVNADVRLVDLDTVVGAFDRKEIDDDLGDRPVVAISFDDGPSFDVTDFEHQEFGQQRSFLNVLRDFRATHQAECTSLRATSFVIASPEARAAMQRAPECGYPDQDDWLNEGWWSHAEVTNLLEIGNHSWDHVHPAVDRLVTTRQQRGDFAIVDNYLDADAEIRRASEYISATTGTRCKYFAYPFGHTNPYLISDYLPQYTSEHRLRAAFSTAGRRIVPNDSIWNIPRVVCGEHWRNPDTLMQLLFD